MKFGYSRGFTLVELLVVLAIIGILTSVVLISLSTVNSRGKDTAVQANLTTVRTQAQFYYNANGDYSPAVTNSCTTAGTMFVADATMAKAIAAADFANGGGATQNIFCNVAADGSAYAVSAAITSGYYCVDSTGVGFKTTTALGNNTFCTP